MLDIKVLDLTRLIPGAICTMMLVDMGADVIKIEDPNGGDYMRWMGPMIDDASVFFRMCNRDKRSVIINLKDERGQAVFKKLVEQADVLVEGFRPGVMSRFGCDYDSLKAINPRLVYCSLSGWGADGPYAELSGHDLNYVSSSGLIGAMETPQVLGGQFADVGGAYAGLSGILAALLARERTGEGAFIDISLSEASLPFGLYNWAEAITMGLPGGGGVLTGGLACYRVYYSRDKHPLSLAALEEKFWRNFCQAVERPDLIEWHQQPDKQVYLRRELEELFALKTADEWESLLNDADCCFMRITPPAEVHNTPHYQARKALGIFPDGTPWMRSPIRINTDDVTINNHVPGYGEHTRAVLREVGYDDAQLDELASAGVIR
ncbi:MAG: hypothetical protein CUN56_04465 [Phototrophicales bacterium]|nr:MAG: hypothetical protein CUN56_04465 [Phototrophicales bacterium]RMG76933.1 MAG: CoA transferase [Chloroflexota bacterium]